MKRVIFLIICLSSILYGYTEDIFDSPHVIGIEAIIARDVFDAYLFRRQHTNIRIWSDSIYFTISGKEEIDSICRHLNKLEKDPWLTYSPYSDSEYFYFMKNGWLMSDNKPGKYADLSLVIYYDDGRLPDLFWDSHPKSFRNELYSADVKWSIALEKTVKSLGQMQMSRSVVEKWVECKINTDDVEWIFFNFLPRNESEHYDRSRAVYRLTTDFVKLGGVRGYLSDKTKISNFLMMLRNMPYRKTNFYSVLETGHQAYFSKSKGVAWTDVAENVLGFITIKRNDTVAPFEVIWINDNETIDRDYFNFSFTEDFKKYLDLIYDKSIFDPKPTGVRMPQWGRERQVD